MKILNTKSIKAAVIVVLSLIFALFAEFSFFIYDSVYEVSGNKSSIMNDSVCKMDVVGYSVDGSGTYTSVTDDAQLIFTDIEVDISSILISFGNKIRSNVNCHVYYAIDSSFSEENSYTTTIPFGADSFALSLPEGVFNDLRIDIDGSFILTDIIVTDGDVVAQRMAVQSFSFLRFFCMFVVAVCVLMFFVKWILSKNPRKLSTYELVFVLGVFVFYFIWAVAKRYNYAPDEAMRYDVTWFLFKHNRLPKYDELLSHWGFSYAHLPAVLCSQLGYVLMKFASIFTTNETYLLLAARMVSVICCTGAVYYVIKLTKILFKSPARWIAIVMFAFMPQFAFIASYVNNDSVALFGIAMIAYAWALGISDDWNIANCALLSIGISVCALSYYNSYAWILVSVFFFVFTYLHKNKKDYKGLFKYVGIIAGIAFILAGYSFIRHLVLYGDLFGFKTSHYYGELYAIPELLPSNRLSIAEQGLSLKYMLFDMGWIKISLQSFIGAFGYMQYFCSDKVYMTVIVFVFIAFVGCAAGLISRIVKKQKPDKMKLIFYISSIACALITICLSIYNSYNTDFQPQGRYCYPAFLSISLMVCLGYDSILKLFKKEKHRYALTAILCTAFIGVSLFVFKSIYLPS